MINLHGLAGLAGARMRGCVQMLIDGVAFPIFPFCGQYHVFSHEGDELGRLTQHDVDSAIMHMKRYGIEVGKMQHFDYDRTTEQYIDRPRHTPCFTFGWQGWRS